ncbi:MAG: hypothetical protein EXR02_02240 [Rhodospirillales bacterium]|nr:hypothetical protein [Rhodospirillales bacterium]
MIVRFVLIGLVLLITACTTKERQVASERAQSELVGLRKDQILECAGAPWRESRSGNMETLVYLYQEDASRRGHSERSAAEIETAPPVLQERWCEATFIVDDGRVMSVRYRGQTGGLLSGRQHICGYIVERCLR